MHDSRPRKTAYLCGVLAVALFSEHLPAAEPATRTDGNIEEIFVFARGEHQIGRAETASEGAVGGADLTVRPLLRVAELLEVVPGMIAAQHSGSGKANQYFLRGFNLDHGTDFTTYVDDLPMNLRTHGHGQGYLDVNGLIPEVIDRIEYRKGPYHADLGDFSLAGAARMRTVTEIDPFIGAELGEYGWRRVAAGGSVSVASGKMTLAGQWKSYDGPWQLPEHLRHASVWGKYTRETSLGTLELTASGYHALWRPTEQIPERVIGAAVCADRFCALDRTATGETLRTTTTARLQANDWRASAYVQYYDWHMLSNPTYDYQINQFDRRWVLGGRYEHDFEFAAAWSAMVGIESRYDDIGNVGVEHTQDGAFVAPISQHAVAEISVGLYSQLTWKPIDPLRVTGGLRGDWYRFEVDAKQPGLDSGSKSVDRVSPKLGIAYEISNRLELYGNWGRGFHSNDARGVVNATTPVPGLVGGTGYETGVRLELGALKITTAYWWLNLASELRFVGDSNSVEPAAGSRRRGFELVAFWRPLDWLAFDAVWTGSHARFRDEPAGDYVPGAVENAGEFGVAAVQGQWELGLRVRHLGSYPLIEDNSEQAGAETLVNVRGAWHLKHITLYGEVLNIFDSQGKDIVYFYGANVAGFDPPGVQIDGRVSRAAEPRTIRIGLSYRF